MKRFNLFAFVSIFIFNYNCVQPVLKDISPSVLKDISPYDQNGNYFFANDQEYLNERELVKNKSEKKRNSIKKKNLLRNKILRIISSGIGFLSAVGCFCYFMYSMPKVNGEIKFNEPLNVNDVVDSKKNKNVESSFSFINNDENKKFGYLCNYLLEKEKISILKDKGLQPIFGLMSSAVAGFLVGFYSWIGFDFSLRSYEDSDLNAQYDEIALELKSELNNIDNKYIEIYRNTYIQFMQENN